MWAVEREGKKKTQIKLNGIFFLCKLWWKFFKIEEKKNFQLNGKAMKIFSTVFFTEPNEMAWKLKTHFGEVNNMLCTELLRHQAGWNNNVNLSPITHLNVPRRIRCSNFSISFYTEPFLRGFLLNRWGVSILQTLSFFLSLARILHVEPRILSYWLLFLNPNHDVYLKMMKSSVK